MSAVQAVAVAPIEQHVADPAKIKALAAKINPYDVQTIVEFGGTDQKAASLAKFNDEILNQAKQADLGAEVDQKFSQIISIAKSIDPKKIGSLKKKNGFVGAISSFFSNTKENIVAKVNTLSEQIDRVVADLDATKTRLQNRHATLEQMFEQHKSEYFELQDLLEAGHQGLEIIRAEIDKRKADPAMATDLLLRQQISDMEATYTRLDRKLASFEAVKTYIVHDLPKIKQIASDNLTLGEKIQDIKQLTIPLWKSQFVNIIILEEQRQSTQLIDSVDDATNDFAKTAADMFGDNVKAIAKTRNRAVLDVETLDHVHNKLLSAFTSWQRLKSSAVSSVPRMPSIFNR
jgi:uncharacterized protein YaaN involved in tellurite resistance